MRSLLAAALLTATLLCVGCLQDDMNELRAVYMKNLTVSSPAFGEGEKIPANYTCDGRDVNPPLNISKIPDGTVSLALIVEDPDAPLGTWDHWIVWNIPPTASIKADSTLGVAGLTSSGKNAYGGPCPPSGTHRYFFKIYALDTTLKLAASSKKEQVLEAMRGHILAEGELIGLYSR